MYEIIGERLIRLADVINAEAIGKVEGQLLEAIRSASSEIIQLVITSPGGVVPLGFRLYDLLRFLNRPELHTIVFGEANSIAILVFLAGDRRLISSSATLMLHRFTRDNTREDYTGAELIATGGNLIVAEMKYAEIIALRSEGGLTADTVHKMMVDETRLTAQEAKDFGLAHEILEKK